MTYRGYTRGDSDGLCYWTAEVGRERVAVGVRFAFNDNKQDDRYSDSDNNF